VRADAARNLELVLTTGARMLAEDPATSIAAIAAEAGVDRRTVYRRFAGREELLTAVYQSRLEAIEAAIKVARFREAPVPVALHRYVEGIVGVNRTWPVELSRMRTDPAIWARRQNSVDEVEVFLQRATDEGFLRPGQPARWAGNVLGQLLHLASRELPQLSGAQAADLLVDTFLRGFGAA
jgi:AcrR family transcriptional regulator